MHPRTLIANAALASIKAAAIDDMEVLDRSTANPFGPPGDVDNQKQAAVTVVCASDEATEEGSTQEVLAVVARLDVSLMVQSLDDSESEFALFNAFSYQIEQALESKAAAGLFLDAGGLAIDYISTESGAALLEGSEGAAYAGTISYGITYRSHHV